MQDSAKKQLFMNKLVIHLCNFKQKCIKSQQLTDILKCFICRGSYRFAHTIVDCSHTFCQLCIFTYIKSFKGRNPTVKCPQCHEQIDSNYSKSIMRDIFKQNLIDMLQPSYIQQQKIIIKRLQQLFPQQDLQFLLDEFKQDNYLNKKYKKVSQKNIVMKQLIHKIKSKLNITFQTFTQQIRKQQKYEQFLAIIKSQNKKQLFIEIKPNSSREEKHIGINNKIKLQGLTIKKIKRFIQKKALIQIDKIQNKHYQYIFFNKQLNRFVFQIELWDNGHKLNQQNQGKYFKLDQLKGPIYYVLL